MSAVTLASLLLLGYIWPFSDIDSHIIRGYGDYNVQASFHPGIDILEPANDEPARAPYENAIIEAVFEMDESTEVLLAIRHTNPLPRTGDECQLYVHIEEDNPYGYGPYYPGESFPNDIIGIVCDYYAPKHIHIANILVDDLFLQPGGWLAQPGSSDILDDFAISNHSVIFSPITGAQTPNSGIMFLPAWIPGSPTIQEEAIFLRGAVNFLIAPRSSITGDPQDNECGVRSLTVNSISKENPITEDEEPSAFYEERVVFDWSYQLLANEYLGDPQDQYRFLYGYEPTPSVRPSASATSHRFLSL